MSKQFYRGYEVVANDNGKAKAAPHDAVYRGAHYDPSAPKAANENARKSKVVYRGVKAA